MARHDGSIDTYAVRRALRAELAERGQHLAGDSHGASRGLYIMGPDDVAVALFEVKPSASDAVYDLMHQGAWIDGMPPRFAVVPTATADADSLDMLEQLRAHPLLFDIEDDRVRFRDLDTVLAAHLDI
ncbi:MAG: hypothetical protein HY876_08240 [Coriobacteriales bacterium]|nr:hypothetical protein [Coriobacteriales bacterium]